MENGKTHDVAYPLLDAGPAVPEPSAWSPSLTGRHVLTS